MAAVACQSGSVRPEEPGPASPRFPFGVASGEAGPDAALLWTLHEGSGSLKVRLWREDGGAAPRVEPVAPGDDGFVHHRVAGLEPGAWYRFAFFELDGSGADAGLDGGAPSGEGVSDTGRFRAAFAPGTLAPLRLGAVSCTHQDAPLGTLVHAAGRGDLDAFMLLGDTLYADGAVDLPGYRQMWRRLLERAPVRALRQATSLVATWDDHEVANNFGGDTVPPAQLQAGRRALFEHLPIAQNPEAPERLWRSFRWGATAELFVLDCRGERNGAAGEYVSRAQLDWLKAGLVSSPARFKVILNSVPITAFPGLFFDLAAADRWEGVPAQRTELLRFVDEARVPGVLWVSGDFHMACAGRVALEGPGARAVELLVGPGGQFKNPSPSYPGPPQFDFAAGIDNYATIDLDPALMTARVQYVTDRGAVAATLDYELG